MNPYIFVAIVAVCFPFFYFSLYRLAKSVAKRRMQQAGLWGLILLFAAIGPYIYVLIFGRNLPWWVYLIIGALVIQGGVSLMKRLKRPRNNLGT